MPTNHNQNTLTRQVAPAKTNAVSKNPMDRKLSRQTLATVRTDSGISGAGVSLTLPRVSTNGTVITTVTPPVPGAATYSITQNFGSPAIAAIGASTGVLTVSDSTNLAAVSSPGLVSVLITQTIGGEVHTQTCQLSLTLT